MNSAPRFIACATQDQIDAWAKVVERVHAKGGYFFAQLFHTGGCRLFAVGSGNGYELACLRGLAPINLLHSQNQVHTLPSPACHSSHSDYPIN